MFIRITSAFQKPNDHLTRSDNLRRKFDLKKIFIDSESKWPRTVENSTGKMEHENYSKWNLKLVEDKAKGESSSKSARPRVQ